VIFQSVSTRTGRLCNHRAGSRRRAISEAGDAADDDLMFHRGQARGGGTGGGIKTTTFAAPGAAPRAPRCMGLDTVVDPPAGPSSGQGGAAGVGVTLPRLLFVLF